MLHRGLADLFPQLDADPDARVAVITGNGRAFSAGGDFNYLDELTRDDELRRQTLVDGRRIVTGMVACRLPSSPRSTARRSAWAAASSRCPTSCSWPSRAHLADPHVMVGLVAADGGPVTWPLLTSLQLAKEYALTGDRIPADRAARDRTGEPRLPRRRGDGPGDGLRPPDREAAEAGHARTPSGS